MNCALIFLKEAKAFWCGAINASQEQEWKNETLSNKKSYLKFLCELLPMESCRSSLRMAGASALHFWWVHTAGFSPLHYALSGCALPLSLLHWVSQESKFTDKRERFDIFTHHPIRQITHFPVVQGFSLWLIQCKKQQSFLLLLKHFCDSL